MEQTCYQMELAAARKVGKVRLRLAKRAYITAWDGTKASAPPAGIKEPRKVTGAMAGGGADTTSRRTTGPEDATCGAEAAGEDEENGKGERE